MNPSDENYAGKLTDSALLLLSNNSYWHSFVEVKCNMNNCQPLDFGDKLEEETAIEKLLISLSTFCWEFEGSRFGKRKPLA